MEIIKGNDFHLKNSSISLGKFEGLHRGHRYLFSKIVEKNGLISTVFTFDACGIPKIFTQDEKNQILESLGVQREIIFPFQEETKNMTAEEFIEKILVEKMDAKYICVGEDFRFGRGRSGDIRLLRKYQEKYGYEVEPVKKLTCGKDIISSTKIRDFLQDGNLEKVNLFLGEEYFVRGRVLSGEELGRKLETPTANIVTGEDKILPRFGVYATVVRVGDKKYFGVTNVGVKPTVGKFPAGIETNLFHFHETIYGEEICVHFCKFLREEKRFPSLEVLKEQIETDKKQAMQELQKMYPEDRIEKG
ncbi:MAG: bifunctional riboflavin kinase/FAD synthetase [Lachnospiraceae bacterium]|nr:bifunctional riboflavin kinase/FAD synthetase [Lachnospiraceae bacterium]